MAMTNTRRAQTGAAAVELGLLFFPMMLIAFGATEFGRAMFQYDALTKGVRNGARYLSQFAAGNSTRIAEAKCLVVFANTACSGSSVVPGLAVSQVAVRDAVSDPSTHLRQPVTVGTTTTGVMNLVTVEISGFQFSSMVPFVLANTNFAAINATMRQ